MTLFHVCILCDLPCMRVVPQLMLCLLLQSWTQFEPYVNRVLLFSGLFTLYVSDQQAIALCTPAAALVQG